jgi:alcohol sulfotransferase
MAGARRDAWHGAAWLLRATTRWGRLISQRLPLPAGLRRAAKQRLIALAFSDADGVIASYPKAGRTWLRFILVNYLNQRFELGLTVDLHSMFGVIPNDILDPDRGRQAYRFGDRPEVPFLVASHTPYRRSLFQSKDILLLLREPKDLMVSAYHHKVNHPGFAGDIKAFLRDPEHGVDDLVRYCNGWAAHIGDHRHLLMSYEQLSADAEAMVERTLRFFGIAVEREMLQAAVAAASFRSMRSVEATSNVPAHAPRPDNPNSFRVRRGRVGSYATDLDGDDIAHVDRTCAEGFSAGAKRLFAAVGLQLG